MPPLVVGYRDFAFSPAVRASQSQRLPDSQTAMVRRYSGLIGKATLPIMQRMVGAAHPDPREDEYDHQPA
jgi:hypothetical protein